MPADRPPVLVLAPPRFIGPLGVMRTLRAWGVRVYGLSHAEPSIAGASRHCAGTFAVGRNGRPTGKPEEAILEELTSAGRRLGAGTVLLPASDEWSVFVATHARELAERFRFPEVSLDLIGALASKNGLHDLAVRHGLPTPRILVPGGERELADAAGRLRFPVMLKPILSRPGSQSLALAGSSAELLDAYRRLGDPGNLLCQEYIPGSDADVWIFNGYFDSSSRCLAAFTGRKIRQHPAHMGLCAFGVCETNPEVIAATERFLAAAGYRGIVDIGYRWDRRDGRYKVLDVNPRLGGAFRMFVDSNGLDVARVMYLDLTGQTVPAVAPREGRKWMLEAGELIAYRRYRRDDGLTLRAWLRSLRGLEEGATLSLSDPLPFLVAMRILAWDTLGGRARGWLKRVSGRRAPASARAAGA